MLIYYSILFVLAFALMWLGGVLAQIALMTRALSYDPFFCLWFLFGYVKSRVYPSEVSEESWMELLDLINQLPDEDQKELEAILEKMIEKNKRNKKHAK